MDTHSGGARHAVSENGMARDELGLEAGGENERDRCEPVGWSHDPQLRRGISSSREEMVLNNTEQGELLGMTHESAGQPGHRRDVQFQEVTSLPPPWTPSRSTRTAGRM